MTVKALFETQIGKESTWGTAVAGAARLMGVEDVHFVPLYQTAEYPDLRANLAPAVLATLEKVAGKCTMKGVALYDDISYFFDSLFSIATPGGAGPYTRAWLAPVAAPTPRSNTILYGSGSDVQRISGAVLSKLHLSGQTGAPVMFDAEFDGKVVDGGGALAGLADRSGNVIMGNHFAVAVDALGGTIGTTVIANTAFAFDLTIESPTALKQYLGSVTPAAYEDLRFKGQLKLTLEVNATSRAYLQAIYNTTPVIVSKLVQLKADDTVNRDLTLQFAGYQNKGPDAYTDRSGVATIDLDLTGLYDAGAFANCFKANNICSLATLVQPMPRKHTVTKSRAPNGHIDIGVDDLSIRINKSEKGLVGALIDLETDSTLSTVIGVMSRFTYHGETKLLPEHAMKIFREFSGEDLDKMMVFFTARVKAVRNEAAPPQNSVG